MMKKMTRAKILKSIWPALFAEITPIGNVPATPNLSSPLTMPQIGDVQIALIMLLSLQLLELSHGEGHQLLNSPETYCLKHEEDQDLALTTYSTISFLMTTLWTALAHCENARLHQNSKTMSPRSDQGRTVC